MKKYKKVLATGLIAMMCLSACGSSASGSGSAGNASAGSASTAKGGSAYDVCYVSTVEDEWLSELLKDMNVSAENNDVALEVKHAGNDSSKVDRIVLIDDYYLINVELSVKSEIKEQISVIDSRRHIIRRSLHDSENNSQHEPHKNYDYQDAQE